MALAAMLFRTQIYAMVPAGQDGNAGNKIQVWDAKQDRFVGEMRSRYEVKGVALRNEVIVMVCEKTVCVYTCDKLQPILYINTAENPRGLCSLTAAGKPWILCCLGENVGEVRVQVGADNSGTSTIQAHERPLAAIVLSPTGQFVATASEFGTVVKVFRREGAELMYRLRLNTPTQETSVSSIAFHPLLPFFGVACASKPYVYLFRVEHCTDAAPTSQDPAKPAQRESGVWGILSSVVKGAVPDYFTDTPYCARFQIPDVDPEGRPDIDTRHEAQARVHGPQLGFHRTEPSFWIMHYNGMLHEAKFAAEMDATQGVQELKFRSSTMWFAVRPDFRMSKLEVEQGGEGDEWAVL